MDINKLTLGEIATAERLSGESIDGLATEGTPKGKAMAALVFVITKRSKPDFTFEDAMNVSLDEAVAIIGDDETDEVKN